MYARLPSRVLLLLLAFSLVAVSVSPAFAQTFPTKPITWVIPFAAGSGTDISSRPYVAAINDETKWTIIVETKPGANGAVGTAAVAKAVPDGYTLLFTGGGSIAKTFIKNLTVDVLVDLTPVIQLSRGALFLFAPTTLPARNIQEFIELVRKNPGKYNYGWTVASNMLPFEVLKQKAQLNIMGIPYSGSPQVIQGMFNGDVIAHIASATAFEGLVNSGRVRILAHLENERFPGYPEVPSTTDAGLAGVRAPTTLAIWAPAKTPAPVVMRLNAAFNSVLKRPEILESIRKSGYVPGGGTPQAHYDYIAAEQAYWAEAARVAKYQPE